MHTPGNWVGLPSCWPRELVTATSWTCPVIDHVERLQRRSNGQPRGWNVWDTSETDATVLLMNRKTPRTGKCWGPVLLNIQVSWHFVNMRPYSMRTYIRNSPQRWICNHMTVWHLSDTSYLFLLHYYYYYFYYYCLLYAGYPYTYPRDKSCP